MRRIPTKPASSSSFYTSILVVPLAVGLLMTAPLHWATALVMLAAVVSLGHALRVATLKVYETPEGLVFRTWFGARTVTFAQIESLRLDTIQGRYGPYAGLVAVRTPRRKLQFLVTPGAFVEESRRLVEHCPHAVLVDDRTGQLRPPHGPETPQTRDLVQRAWRRMNRRHALRAILIIALIAAYLAALAVGLWSSGHPAAALLAVTVGTGLLAALPVYLRHLAHRA